MSTSDHGYTEDFQALAGLADVFSELVKTLTAGGHGDLNSPQLVALSTRWMPRAQVAALAAEVDGSVRTLAATDPSYMVIDRIRRETGEGPALDVLEGNDVVVTDCLPEDPRWPRYAPRVSNETGVVSIVAYRLHAGRGSPAVLSFYSDWPWAFDNLAITTGLIIAGYASLAFKDAEPCAAGTGPVRSHG